MYQSLLTRKYLTSKIMPLLAMVAVMLSVATVLITWSVMGGFLRTLLDSGKSMIGDVAITWPTVGFAHYDDLVERLEADDDIVAAAPIIETFGLVNLPDGRVDDVVIKGIDAERFWRVTTFDDALWWKPIDTPTRRDKAGEDPRLREDLRTLMDVLLAQGRGMYHLDDETGRKAPAALLGIEIMGSYFRTDTGIYDPEGIDLLLPEPDGGVEQKWVFMPRNGRITLTVPAFDSGGQVVDFRTKAMPVANEFQTGVYEVDSRTVMLPLDILQSMLHMDEAKRIEESEAFDPFNFGGEDGAVAAAQPAAVAIDPARVTTVLVRARDGLTADEVKVICRRVYQSFAQAHPGAVPSAGVIQVNSWEDLNATMISAVKKETGLVLFVFGVVCFTTVFLVLAIFWSMVSEKTRDIGVLRALGASMTGVAWMWLRYGMAIGVVGSLMGTVAAVIIVTNINPIHEWMAATLNFQIWDPKVYYFIEIPREVQPRHAVIVFLMGVGTCLFGAAVPAVRAARMDPVQALRFE